MPSGYEKSPDYGSRQPKHPWLGFMGFIAFFAGVTALVVWLRS